MGSFRKTELERLGYQPNAYVVQKFWELCQQQLNVSGNPNKCEK
jgi:cohesin complex subunit SA-1/2